MMPFVDLQQEFENGSRSGFAEQYGYDLLQEMTGITAYQWEQQRARALIKGFLLSGPPGTGKTTLARRLAYELGLLFGAVQSPDAVSLVFVDGSEIARARYGESEERIRQIFRSAQSTHDQQTRRTVLLFDDVESILMARGAQHAKEWHFSQDSVFFHAVDTMDCARTIIVLTTNRPDLVDEAIKDRFLEYRVAEPGIEMLVQVAMAKAHDHDLPGAALAELEHHVRDKSSSGALSSLRDVEKLVLQIYVERALGRPSVARNVASPNASSRT